MISCPCVEVSNIAEGVLVVFLAFALGEGSYGGGAATFLLVRLCGEICGKASDRAALILADHTGYDIGCWAV